MNYLKILLIIYATNFCYSCKNKQLVSGQLKNLTGLENCSWIIELDKADKNGNKKLEPTNLKNFKVTLAEGNKVKLSYKEVNVMSTCMAGKPVEIILISDK